MCSDSSLTAIMWCYIYCHRYVLIPGHACMHREHVKIAGATCRGHSDDLHEGKQDIPMNISNGNEYQHEKGGVSSLGWLHPYDSILPLQWGFLSLLASLTSTSEDGRAGN